MKQLRWSLVLAMLLALSSLAFAQNNDRGRSPGNNGNGNSNAPRDTNRDRAPQAERERNQNADRGRSPGQANRERDDDNDQGGRYYDDWDDDWDGYPRPGNRPGNNNGQGWGQGQGNPNQWPDSYGQYRRVPYAEAIIDHASPRTLELRLGTTDGMVRDIPLRIEREEGVDIVRGRDARDREYWDNIPQGQRTFVAYADLRNWHQFLDGRREWSLRIMDRAGNGGLLRGFRIVTSGGTQQVRQVPARFQRNRLMDARLTPRPMDGYTNPRPGDWNPRPGEWDGGNWDTSGVGVYRELPRNITAGRTFTYELRVNLPNARVDRLDVTDNVPRGWRIVDRQPRTTERENNSQRAVWRIDRPNRNERFRITVEVPYNVRGTHTFSGTYRLHPARAATIMGPTRINLDGYGDYGDWGPYGGDYNDSPWWRSSDNPLERILDVLGAEFLK